MNRPLIVLAALLAAPAAHAVTVNLQPGDDVGQLTGAAAAGDEYIFADGVYELDEVVDWSGAGTETQPIVFKAAEGAAPILRTSTGWSVAYVRDSTFVRIEGLVFENDDEHYEANGSDGLVIQDSSNVEVTDVEIRHIGGTGIYLAGNVASVTISRTHIHDTRSGGGIYSGCWDASCWTQDTSIENCWIHDIQGDYNWGIYVENGGQGLRIVDNVIYQTSNGGIRTASTEFGAANVIEGNALWSGVNRGIQVTGAATVRNNIVFNYDGNGIYSQDNERGTLESVVISHNTVVDTTDWGIQVRGWSGTTGMVVANNVVSNPIGLAFQVGESETDEAVFVAGNRFTGYVDAPSYDPVAGTYGAGQGDADFQDAPAWDFYPTAASSLINAADASSSAWVPETDFNGVPRDGLAPDVGAYEYLGAENPGWVLEEGFKDIGFSDNSAQDLGGCGCNKGTEASTLAPLLFLAWGRRRRRV